MSDSQYFTIQGVQSSQIDAHWCEVEPWLSAACEFSNGAMYPGDIKAACEAQEFQLWKLIVGGTPVGCFVTKIARWPNGRQTLEVPALGGNGMSGWLGGVVSLLKDFAREHGCDSVMATGRPGWERELRKYGWKQATVTMITEV